MRLVILPLVVAGALVGSATPAFAHGGDAPTSTAYLTTVSGIVPAQAGLSVRAVEGGARLELTNRTGRTVEILGYAGEPYLQVRPDGTYENVNSPATYLNQTLAGDTPLPATADPTAPPQWRRISGEPTVRWHDQRSRWTDAGLPPAAHADPDRRHRLRTWSVPLREQARTFEIRGTLDYLPPPPAWAWWAGALLLAAATTVAGLRRPLAVSVLALLAGTTLLGYAVAHARDSAVSPVLFVAAAMALVAGFWRTPFGTALGGGMLAVFGGLANAGVFRGAVVAAAGPAWFTRAAVLVAIGVGVGMLLSGMLRLRATSDPGAKVHP